MQYISLWVIKSLLIKKKKIAKSNNVCGQTPRGWLGGLGLEFGD